MPSGRAARCRFAVGGSSRGGRSSTWTSYSYSAATARGRALTTDSLPEVISSWIHL